MTVKILAASAVLSLAAVTATNLPASSGGLAPAKFPDRLAAVGEAALQPALLPVTRPATGAPASVAGAAKGDRAGDRTGGVRPACGGAWPYVQAMCIADAGASAPSRRVRVVTIERRPETGVSVLERVAAAEVAAIPAVR